jgi:hypothetical protein
MPRFSNVAETACDLTPLLFQDEIAAHVSGLAAVADYGQPAAATAQVVVEADEVVQAPGFSQGGITTGGSFAEHCIFFHGVHANAIS